jgi:hypothetical protein
VGDPGRGGRPPGGRGRAVEAGAIDAEMDCGAGLRSYSPAAAGRAGCVRLGSYNNNPNYL